MTLRAILGAAALACVHAAASAAAPGPVAAYSFDEGTRTTVADASGNGSAGAIGSATSTTVGRYGGALAFNGTDAVVTINGAPSLDLTTAMTLEAWVYPAAVTGTWRHVIYKGKDNSFLEATTPPASVPAAGARLRGNDVEAFGSATLPVITWTHLDETYDGATLELYVNGVLAASLTHAGPVQTSANPLQIGGGGIFGQSFEGAIDEVRVYDAALTAAQIRTDMSTPIGAPTAPGSLTARAVDGSAPTWASDLARAPRSSKSRITRPDTFSVEMPMFASGSSLYQDLICGYLWVASLNPCRASGAFPPCTRGNTSRPLLA